ncbi:MAG TPA: addiction module protein [Longimicrobium sp.]|nr:addiction module protein [Longimicrobium sp.]
MEMATIPAPAMTLEELKEELLRLPPEERFRLTNVLTQSVERERAAAGSIEGKRRYEAYLRGEIEAYPLDEALNELRSKLLG